MGVSFSCLLAAYWNAQDVLKPAIVGSIFLDDDQQRTTTTSLSVNFSHQDSQSNMMHVSCSESDFSLLSPDSKETVNQSPRPKMAAVETPQSPTLNLASPKHEAAIKLQKVYKSFRTRRKLADCAVLIDQSWWKLLDFAELKHSSISYFDIDKHETAISRWSRARTRAAKVGKGLSKNGKAQKLALQHWLEAIDPRHRYGHNLHFYYVKWLHSQSKEPFFYWLDIGEGKEINLVEKCSRSKLQQQCIKYLGPMERKAYEVALEDGKLWYKQTGELLDTTGEPKAKWIFVLSTSRTLYVARKRKGTFQHSSFLAGGAALAAGRIGVEEGILKAVWPHSGHYRPTPENFQDFISFLKENNVELNDVKLDSADEEEDSVRKVDSSYLRVNSSEDDLGEKHRLDSEENDVDYLRQVKRSLTKEAKENAEEMPSNDDLIGWFNTEAQAVGSVNGTFPPDSQKDTYEIVEEVCSNLGPNLFGEDHHETGGAKVSKDMILGRITPCKRSKSCQFLKQLRGTWSTGAGPRIGCLRDYPSELKSHALEEANLSPRTSRGPGFSIFSSVPTTSGLNAEIKGTTLCCSTEKGNLLQHRIDHP